ncbi:MAG: PIN domain nuclease [Acidimicrobiaceae bacterium]|nr:PIN domain nuclease [Acidimicrobiaceae bacterium]
MTLIDTSAWVEFLRGTGSKTHREVRRLLAEDALIHTTDVVVMELLAGARDGEHEQQLRRLLGRCDYLPIEGLAGYEAAASIYRACRRAGATVRALTDCLIAGVALRAGTPVLHNDRDFDVLARYTAVATRRGEPG